MKISAMIMVRGGSTRVKNKNIRPFAGTNLLTIKIKQLLQIERINEVIVNSDDDEMLRIAAGLGAKPVKRDAYYASNSVSINEVYKNLAENCDADYIIHCNATNPLLESKTIEKLIDTFFEVEGEYDSVNSAGYIREFMWLDGKSINYDVSNMPRSQDLPNIMALNFAANMISRNNMMKCANIVSNRPYLMPIDDYEAVDIDYEIDFEIAELLYKKKMGIE